MRIKFNAPPGVNPDGLTHANFTGDTTTLCGISLEGWEQGEAEDSDVIDCSKCLEEPYAQKYNEAVKKGLI